MKKNGFTLVELLAVVALIGIIAAIVLPNISKTLKSGNKDLFKVTAAALEGSAELYISDNSNLSKYRDLFSVKGKEAIITIQELIDNDYLDKKVRNNIDDQEISNASTIRIENVGEGGFDFTFTYPSPNIVLTSGNEISVKNISDYSENSYPVNAYDLNGLDLTAKVKKTSPVYDAKEDCYIVKYNVADKNGVASTERVRRIIVSG